jgi:peptidoglycan/LPS O-acetylase OafA/YrhL
MTRAGESGPTRVPGLTRPEPAVTEHRRDRGGAPVTGVGAGEQLGHPGKRGPGGFRPDIQALRALAVSVTVVSHLWPNSLFAGGYVGVDVFFVISGFLISSQLIREIDGTGRLRLARFYARRVRRLLPAAFLVLVFVATAAYLLVPRPQWPAYGREITASALYWQNWLVATKPGDPTLFTALQHYWSLSVEEQFYLCWPLLLLVLFKIPAKVRFTGIAVVGLASLAFSVYLTGANQYVAYLITPVRVWEFALGAVVAMAGTKLELPRIAANLASLAGMAAMLFAVYVFDGHSEFPGALALVPAVGAALVIAGGTSPHRQWHTPVTSWAPVQLVGDLSYSLYLWHWPLIVLAGYAFPGAVAGGTLSTPVCIAIVAASLALAYLSTRFVEDPIRFWPPLVRNLRLTFTSMVAGIVVVCAVASGLLLA